MQIDEFFVKIKSSFDDSGFNKMDKTTESIAKKVDNLQKKYSKIFTVVKIAVPIGLNNVSKKFEEIGALSRQTKIDIEGFQKIEKLGSITIGTNAEETKQSLLSLMDISRKINMGFKLPVMGLNTSTNDPIKMLKGLQAATSGLSYQAKKTYLEFNQLPVGLLNLLNQSREQMEKMSRINVLSKTELEKVNKFTESWKYLKTQLISIKDITFATIGIELTDIFNDLGDILGEIYGWVKIIIKAFTGAYSFVFKPIIALFKIMLNILSPIKDAINNSAIAAGLLKVAFLGIIVYIARMSPLLSKFGLGITPLLLKFTLLAAIIEDIYVFMKGGDSVIGNIGPMFEKLATKISENLPKIASKIGEIIAALVPIIVKALTEIVPQVISGIGKGIFNGVLGALEGADRNAPLSKAHEKGREELNRKLFNPTAKERFDMLPKNLQTPEVLAKLQKNKEEFGAEQSQRSSTQINREYMNNRSSMSIPVSDFARNKQNVEQNNNQSKVVNNKPVFNFTFTSPVNGSPDDFAKAFEDSLYGMSLGFLNE